MQGDRCHYTRPTYLSNTFQTIFLVLVPRRVGRVCYSWWDFGGPRALIWKEARRTGGHQASQIPALLRTLTTAVQARRLRSGFAWLVHAISDAHPVAGAP